MKTVINIKADKEVKEKAQRIARTLGLPLSTVINAYLRQFIRNKEVHFSLTPTMTPRLERILAGVERDIKRGRNISPPFSSAKEAVAYLRS
jgi:addiction module RelB/DinJ family antitoxin